VRCTPRSRWTDGCDSQFCTSSTASQAGLAIDTQSLASLKLRANTDPKGAVREAAKQLESLFMQELVKSMRASTLQSGMLDNSGTSDGHRDAGHAALLAAQRAAGRPVGRHHETARAPDGPVARPHSVHRLGQQHAGAAFGHTAAHAHPADRRGGLRAAAQCSRARGRKATGIPAAFMVSQAALETGWGRKEIKHADGTPSFNLFGIKAGGSWKGPVAEITTTEYINGKAQKVVAKFRAYGSYAESFADYAG
jgi:flagellar protein FlgJ